jgi:circadian clock protein KaiB
MGVQSGSHDTAKRMRLKLYVAGSSARSERAIRNLYEIVARLPSDLGDVEVVDVLNAPERAEQDRILATPTLLKEFPPPRRRVTGDLSNVSSVMRALAPDLPPTVLELAGWFASTSGASEEA